MLRKLYCLAVLSACIFFIPTYVAFAETEKPDMGIKIDSLTIRGYMAGPNQDETDLKGKVVLMHFWGTC